MLHGISSVVLGLIALGIMRRHHPQIHLRCMITAFVLDLGLVLYIETTRHAVEKVATQPGMLLWFHASVSLLVLAAYIGQITLGRQMLAGVDMSRQLHKIVGISFCSLRVVNYITSFIV